LALQQRQAQLIKAQTEAEALWQAAQTTLQQLHAAPQTDNNADMIDQQLQQLGNDLRQASQRQGEIRALVSEDDQRRTGLTTLLAEIAVQQQHYDLWQRLNSLIGSADGANYRRFAQGLTLEHLIELANRQLQRLQGRYQLCRKQQGELELEVRDTWLGDELRDTRNLSGGESFLVSLALALALSDLVSHKASIDSLFLDEGFGTLDADTLEIALDALDSLNASGKTIGVISHVEAMKERIPVQLRCATCRRHRLQPAGAAVLDGHWGSKTAVTGAPADATTEQLVFVTKMRWRIERDYQELKQEFGLSHYEGRGWLGFHHHATLCIAAYGYLVAQRLKHGGSKKKLRSTRSVCLTQRLRPSRPADERSAMCLTRFQPCASSLLKPSSAGSVDAPVAAEVVMEFDTVRLAACRTNSSKMR
jgi:hypothetical protein